MVNYNSDDFSKGVNEMLHDPKKRKYFFNEGWKKSFNDSLKEGETIEDSGFIDTIISPSLEEESKDNFHWNYFLIGNEHAVIDGKRDLFVDVYKSTDKCLDFCIDSSEKVESMEEDVSLHTLPYKSLEDSVNKFVSTLANTFGLDKKETFLSSKDILSRENIVPYTLDYNSAVAVTDIIPVTELAKDFNRAVEPENASFAVLPVVGREEDLKTLITGLYGSCHLPNKTYDEFVTYN